MMRERIEGKWLAAFARVFALNGIDAGTTVAIVSETQSRPVLVELSELGLFQRGADFCRITMPTPPQTAPVPVKSTGTSLAIAGNRAAIEAHFVMPHTQAFIAAEMAELVQVFETQAQ